MDFDIDTSMAMANLSKTLVAVVGPTAVGKTAVAIALAEQLNGEIVSADAVAVYRGLNIGAAKPDETERARAVFHLLDVVAPNEEFTVADFERLAQGAITEIRERERVPLLVGGTGLYVRSVTSVLTIPEVPPQPDLRTTLWADVENFGSAALHVRLLKVDAPSAAKILPGDAKRIIRALEVWQVTGEPLSSFHTPEGVHGILRPNVQIYGLRMERKALYQRIEQRVDAMLAGGLVDEVRGLLARGYGPDLKSMQSLGYRHIAAYLNSKGTVSLEQAVDELKRDTRRYAKRQMSWFNADPHVQWVEVGANELAGNIARQIAEQTTVGSC